MSTKSQSNSPNDDLLVSWKDIAAYLKCSVRKAQRLEQQELPVNRISGTKSVWASKLEIDRWLITQAQKTKELQTELATINASARIDADPSEATVFEQADAQGAGTSAITAFIFRASLWLLGISLGLTFGAAMVSAYGLTIVFFGMTAALVVVTYHLLPDTSYTRAMIGLFAILGMSYCASATTLPDVVDSVVNMTTLRPALAYPFVVGLRFIPALVLIVVMLVVLASRNNLDLARHPPFRAPYVFLGLLVISVTSIGNLIGSGAHRIWQAGLPIRWTLLAGESFIVAVNVALFVTSCRFLSKAPTNKYRQLLSWCGVGYLTISLTAAIVNRHWNETEKYYLHVRHPDEYRVQNTNAAEDLHNWLNDHAAEAGADLTTLANDPAFLQALLAQSFYKQNFDEVFQVSNKAAIFGYESPRDSQNHQPPFLRIRFPASLASVLHFEPVRR